MLECFINNIFAMFGGYIFQQTVDILIGTNCAPLLADVFLYSYRASQEKTKSNYPDPLISRSTIQKMYFH